MNFIFRKNWFRITVVLVATLTAGYLFHIQTKDRKVLSSIASEKMHEIDIGRYLIGVPQGYKLEYLSYKIDGVSINFLKDVKTKADFEKLIANREAELRQKDTEKYIAPNRTEKLKDSPNIGIVSYYDHTSGKSGGGMYGADGKRITSFDEDGVTVEALIWVNESALRLFGEDLALPRSSVNIARFASAIRGVPENEGPSSGFALTSDSQHRYVIPDGPIRSEHETAEIQFGISGHPDVKYRLVFDSNPDKLQEPLSSGHQRARERIPNTEGRIKEIRFGRRVVNGMDGEELVQQFHEENGTKGHSFDWEWQGKTNDLLSPNIHLEAKTGYSRNSPVNSSFSTEAATLLWDKIVLGIRPR